MCDAMDDTDDGRAPTKLWEVVDLGLPQAPRIELLQPAVRMALGSSRTMAKYLCANPDLINGRAVLELGAGDGLSSLLAAALGAAHVVATDSDPYAVSAMALAIAHNGLRNNVFTDNLDLARHQACAAACGSWRNTCSACSASGLQTGKGRSISEAESPWTWRTVRGPSSKKR